MQNQKKTFLSGLIALLFGTSCCWFSTIAIWTGGAGLLGLLANYAEKMQVAFMLVGFTLVFIAFYKYIKVKKNEN